MWGGVRGCCSLQCAVRRLWPPRPRAWLALQWTRAPALRQLQGHLQQVHQERHRRLLPRTWHTPPLVQALALALVAQAPVHRPQAAEPMRSPAPLTRYGLPARRHPASHGVRHVTVVHSGWVPLSGRVLPLAAQVVYVASDKNKDVILGVLAPRLTQAAVGTRPVRVIEIASGTGQHAAYFCKAMPHVEWTPTGASSRRLTRGRTTARQHSCRCPPPLQT